MGDVRVKVSFDLNTSKDVIEKYDESLVYNKPFGKYKLSIIADRIRRISGLNPEMNVLEVASGTGELALRLSKGTLSYYSTDINKNMLYLQKTKLSNCKADSITCVLCDALKLPFKDNYFDIVLERNISLLYDAFFLHDGTAEKLLNEMVRVTKNKVVIVHQNKTPLSFSKNEDPTIHYFKESEIKDLLEKSGLVDIRVTYVTHSTKLLYDIFGDNCRILESFLSNLLFFKKLGGSIIACGSKPI